MRGTVRVKKSGNTYPVRFEGTEFFILAGGPGRVHGPYEVDDPRFKVLADSLVDEPDFHGYRTRKYLGFSAPEFFGPFSEIRGGVRAAAVVHSLNEEYREASLRDSEFCERLFNGFTKAELHDYIDARGGWAGSRWEKWSLVTTATLVALDRWWPIITPDMNLSA